MANPPLTPTAAMEALERAYQKVYSGRKSAKRAISDPPNAVGDLLRQFHEGRAFAYADAMEALDELRAALSTLPAGEPVTQRIEGFIGMLEDDRDYLVTTSRTKWPTVPCTVLIRAPADQEERS